jgi:hypothetical protein
MSSAIAWPAATAATPAIAEASSFVFNLVKMFSP